ncbi:DDE_3 domain-containing protein [Trichonephila clavipes]|nr:DDE_3 domain-containing protein [Trichonephila clavipes]
MSSHSSCEQLFESEDIERMDWPARSPDLNPIEHVWDFLGRRLTARTLPPVTIRELRLALQDEWAAMPQQLIDTLILRMGRRCETCLAVLLTYLLTPENRAHPKGLELHSTLREVFYYQIKRKTCTKKSLPQNS